MFKKVHDRMFRKAWMKLFTMIVGILLVVFIALIAGINMITEAVLNGQSKDILQQIASDLEYNEDEAAFVYIRGDARSDERITIPAVKTTEPSSKVSSAVPSAPSTGTETSSATEEHTDNTSQQGNSAPASDPPSQGTPDNPQESQPTEPKNEKNPWLIIPTFPEDATYPTVPSDSGQEQKSGQNWGDPGGFTWDGGGMDWGNMQDQFGQNWNNGQTWGGDPNWNGNAFWEQGGGNTQDGWSKDDWWKSGSNPYTMWVPYNPMNPMNPANPFFEQYKSNETPKSNSKESRDADQNENTDEDESTDEDENIAEEAVLSQTAGNGKYELRLLADSASSMTASDTGKVSEMRSTSSSNKVEAIPRKLGSIEYFAIMADKNGRYLATLYNDQLGDAKAQKYISPILNDDQDTGMINSYQYYRADKSNGTMMVMTDKSYEKGVFSKLKRITVIVGLTALIFLSVLAYFFSKKSIQPIKIAFDKQKQFVSDASHELKTPLTVISTNADVLEGEIGENKWLGYIKSQTDRMSVLVNDLLNLTRLENSGNELEKKYFNLSKAIANTALPFECQAFESNKKFEVNIEDDIMLSGSEKHIKQMAAIFIDNALKYSESGGTVQVTLKRSGDRKLFSVYNTGQGIKETDTEKIFERFYRSDESRNRATGGYGLGLAIAKSVADKHRFKIHVLNQPGKGVCFIVTM